MKDYYKQLGIHPYASSIEEIQDAIQAAPGTVESADAIKHILVSDERRAIYDRTHRVVSTIGTLRSNLGLTNTGNWLETDNSDFDRMPATRSELAIVTREAPRPQAAANPKQNSGSRASSKPKQNRTVKKWIIRTCLLALAAILLGGLFLPWPHYQYALFANTPEAYRTFTRRFPQTEYARDARSRRKVILDEAAWGKASSRGSLESYQAYLDGFPDGIYSFKANTAYRRMLNEQWAATRSSRHPDVINQFLETHPNSGKDEEAQAIIAGLHRDWSWVREQDNLEDYRRYRLLVPNAPQTRWIDARIIDLEVAQIAAGDYGALPASTPTRRIPGAVSARVSIENATRYQITVRYSGPESRRIDLSPNSTQTIYLRTGDYQVAASATLGQVRSYYGRENLSGGEYDVQYYIVTDVNPSGSYRRR